MIRGEDTTLGSKEILTYQNQQQPQEHQQQQQPDRRESQLSLKGNEFVSRENSKTELYEEEQCSLTATTTKPWWMTPLLFAQPTLFGTWDGVFTSCMINMFGVVVFLRMGWMVGNAGVGYSILIIIITELVALVTILSSIGVCERCYVDSGGIYSLLSRVLGNRIGASISLIYCFGQAIACSLCVVAFGESVVDLLEMQDDVWVTRAIAAGLLLILVGINVAGVLWVVGLQLIFVVLLFIAILDFIVGSFVRTDQDRGIVGYQWQTFLNNTRPSFKDDETFFSVLGVFFPSVCGVFGGFNMSGDLKDPKTNIPVGTLTAVVVCSLIYVTFALILGATCLRSNLKMDFMIADKISATRVFWIIGLYELSVSSAAGNISGPPHILQAIAADHSCTILEPLAEGKGPNKVPVFAILLFAVISLAFIFVGQLNTLGPILTMPFLLTYAAVDYAYFNLITTLNMKKKAIALQNSAASSQHDEDETFDVLQRRFKGYGATENRICRESEMRLTDTELGNLFRSEEAGGALMIEEVCDLLQPSSPGLKPILNSNSGRREETSSNGERDESLDSADHAVQSLNEQHIYRDEEMRKSTGVSSRYKFSCNRWISLFGALISIAAMFGIQWQYALANVVLAIALWLLVGMTNACVFPGIGEFSVKKEIHQIFRNIYYRITCKKERKSVVVNQIVMRENTAMFQTKTGQISDENEDFADREPYHQAEVIDTIPLPLTDEENAS